MQRRDIAIGTGRILGALALFDLAAACNPVGADDNTASSSEAVSWRKQSDLPAAAPSAGLLPGTTTWIVPATPNGLQPIQSWFSVSGLPDGQQAALLAALPALENLAEDLRKTVRRGRDRLRDSPRPI